MASCMPGPNVQDQTSPFPWQCKALGERTPGKTEECSADGEDCRETKCCKAAGSQCYRKGKFWAACRASCTPGPDLQAKDWEPWSCEAVGPRNFGAAPWVAQTCAKGGENCQPKGCCAAPGHQCYTQSPWYSKCMPTCTPGMKLNPWDKPWECKELGMRTPERFEDQHPQSGGMVSQWTVARCSGAGENCRDTKCHLASGGWRSAAIGVVCGPMDRPGCGGHGHGGHDGRPHQPLAACAHLRPHVSSAPL